MPIIVGLGLASPLSTMALVLEGTKTYTEEVNIPTTHNSENDITGIVINNYSNTVFEKKVTINMVVSDSVSGIQDTPFYIPFSSYTVFNDALTINIKSNDTTSSRALHLSASNSSITVNGLATLSNSCRTSCHDYSGDIDEDDSDSIEVFHGKLTLNGGSIITGGIYAADYGEIIINGKSIINGNIDSYDDGKVSLNLANGSNFTRYAASDADTEDEDGVEAGVIDINMASGSTWNIKNDSYITSLSGQGMLNFNNTNSEHEILYIENLSGSSIFNMRTNIAQQKSDQIVVNNATGNHTLNMTNNGSASTTGKETLTLVEGGNNRANNSATFKLGNAVELGGYKYNLSQNGNNWLLASGGNSSKPQMTSTATAGASFLNTNYLMSYIETQTLLQRLGDMRHSGDYGNVWLRGFAGKMDSFSGRLSKFDMNYHGFQFGADKQLSETSPLVVGAFVGQTYGNPDYRSGDGSWKSFNTGIYASYLDNDGFYLDGVAKYVRQKNHFKVRDTANRLVL